MQQTHMHKVVAGRVEAIKLLSRRRQSDYSIVFLALDISDWVPFVNCFSGVNLSATTTFMLKMICFDVKCLQLATVQTATKILMASRYDY